MAVLWGGTPEGLHANATVRIMATVKRLSRSSFQQALRPVEDELFDDADTFFQKLEGQPALTATKVELLQANSQSRTPRHTPRVCRPRPRGRAP